MQQSQIDRPTNGAESSGGKWRRWLFDLTFGSVVGAIVGAVAAANIVILGGIDRGYEATFDEIFGLDSLAGGLAAIAFATGIIGGVVIMRRRRGDHSVG